MALKIKLALFLAAMTWGFYEGRWAGAMAVFMIVGFIGLFTSPKQPSDQEVITTAVVDALKQAELVPAKRGKPDPTRPWPGEAN